MRKYCRDIYRITAFYLKCKLTRHPVFYLAILGGGQGQGRAEGEVGINLSSNTKQAFPGTHVPMLFGTHSLLVPWIPSDLFGLLESASMASEQTPAF